MTAVQVIRNIVDLPAICESSAQSARVERCSEERPSHIRTSEKHEVLGVTSDRNVVWNKVSRSAEHSRASVQ